MRRVVLLGLALLASAAPAQDLMEMLEKGPVVLVEVNDKGKFDRATAVVHIKRPPAEVWKLATNYGEFKTFMPKLLKSDVRKVTDTQYDVDYEIEVPGVNTSYTFRYDVEPDKMKTKGQWLKGDLKGSYCIWRLVPYKEDTLFYYTNASRNFSALAQGLEDDQQTITVGVNVAAAISVVKAVKSHMERPAQAAEK